MSMFNHFRSQDMARRAEALYDAANERQRRRTILGELATIVAAPSAPPPSTPPPPPPPLAAAPPTARDLAAYLAVHHPAGFDDLAAGEAVLIELGGQLYELEAENDNNGQAFNRLVNLATAAVIHVPHHVGASAEDEFAELCNAVASDAVFMPQAGAGGGREDPNGDEFNRMVDAAAAHA